MISTHILDTAQGRPAPRIPVELDVFISGHGWKEVGRGVTNMDGEIAEFGEPPAVGLYRLMFDIAAYMPRAFFPSVALTFEIHEADRSYHLPLLLSPYGYSACVELE
jgi:5-hydroxyisourate hydrolase